MADRPEQVPAQISVATPVVARSGLPGWYPDLLASVAGRIASGHRRAVRAANTELLATYWAIGRDILDRQQEQGWGTKVIDRLSADLRERFPDAKGFSPRNLKYMRAFAAAWPSEAIVQAPLAQLPWYHQLALLDRLDSPDQRTWYAAMAAEHGWSRNVLAHQIDTRLKDRTGRAVSNFSRTLPAGDSDLAQQATRDPYLFDFLATDSEVRERDLETALVEHIGRFLLELGQGFAFVGRQVRLTIGDQEFFCDLLFYHYRLRRFVVVELKAGHFEPGHVGQLGMYLAAVDDLLAQPDDGPTIGLLLVRTSNRVVAEYALRGQATPIGVAQWTTELEDSLTAELTTELPAELAARLPTIADLEAGLTADLPGPPEPGAATRRTGGRSSRSGLSRS